MHYRLLLLFVGSLQISCGSQFQTNKPASECSNPLGGEWKFGQAPYGCDFHSTDEQVRYENLIYKEQSSNLKTTKNYIESMQNFLDEYSTAYLKRRAPQATDQELEAWNQLVYTTAQQESYWTHYRLTEDQQLKFFKGDSHFGYGLMQVDKRWHEKFVSSGEVYDLEKHLIYALDELYESWLKAKKNPCDPSRSYESINRSAYSAYNGGPRALCRWQNENHRWAKNDKNFFKKYLLKEWENL